MSGPNNFSQITLTVFNQTANDLNVGADPSGIRGSDLTNVAWEQKIDAHGGVVDVASFHNKFLTDCYDWVYLLDQGTGRWYQIFLQITVDGTSYWSFGFSDIESNPGPESSNPIPFPDGCAEIAFDDQRGAVDYILLTTPTYPGT